MPSKGFRYLEGIRPLGADDICQRTCSKCGITKPKSSFIIRHDVPDHRSGVCKECTRKEYQEHVASMTEAKILEIEKAKPFKICKRCRENKPITDFRIYLQTDDGHCTLCASCELERNKERYYKRDEYQVEYRAKTKPYYSNWHSQKREEAKRELLTHYGNGRCACVLCGETRLPCLSIDHINCDGAAHRKSLSLDPNDKHTGLKMYKWLRENNYPSGFRTLCMNCQFVALHEYREKLRKAGKIKRDAGDHLVFGA